jgi:hypothetical protein
MTLEARMSGQTDPLPANSPGQSGIERRVATRYPCNLATSCRLMASFHGGRPSARVRNISATGISLVVSQPIDPGVVLTVELKSAIRSFSRTVQLKVAYCIDHPNGDSILGGAFMQDLAEDELRIFVG